MVGKGTIARPDGEEAERISLEDQARAVVQLIAAATASIAEQAFYFAAIDVIGPQGFESRKGLTEYVDAYGNMVARPSLTAFRFITSLSASATARYVADRATGLSAVHFVRPPLAADEWSELEGWVVWVHDQRGGPRRFVVPRGYVGYDPYGRLLLDARQRSISVALRESESPHVGGDTLILLRVSGSTLLSF